MKKILIIDDIPANLYFMEIILGKKLPEYMVLTAMEHKSGLSLAENELPELIILDLNLPEVNGYEICKTIRAKKSTKDIPVLMVSSSGDNPKIRTTGLLAGADLFISRPFNIEEFVAVVQVMLRKKEVGDLLKKQNKQLDAQIKKQLNESVEQERRHEQISSFVAEFFWEVNAELRYTYISPTIKNILGYKAEEIIDTFHLFDFIDEGYSQQEINVLSESIRQGESFSRIKIQCRAKDGDRLWFVFSGFPIFDQNDELIGYRGAFSSITQQIIEEEKHALVINTSMDGFVMLDEQNNIIEVNQAFCKLTGYPCMQLLGKNFTSNDDLFTEDKLRPILDLNLNSDKNNKTSIHHRIETKLKTNKGEVLDVELSINFSVIGEDNRFIFVRDITERKRIEESEAKNLEQIQTYQDKLKSLHLKLINTEDEVRKKTAAFLHDGISQNLAMATMKLSAVADGIVGDKKRQSLNDALQLIEKSIKESRLLTYDLSPPILHELGLVQALKWKLEKIEAEFGIQTRLVEKGNLQDIYHGQKLMLYRILLELFNNTVKHAGASELILAIGLEEKGLSFKVTDNGKGFNTDDLLQGKGGFGLFNIREQLASVKGSFEIESVLAKGTTINITLPNE
ncbi:MAG: PAS domain S-box protein [Bacteroidetes bacterium]|nr:PAS domain S-box protein [Bacteroidota bacterium]MBU1579763.1 PAS domain S-box protein [Bacteroidota bacterium]MBU2556763.1 PAS domain S-box protein [Bacteroidota bacterium]